MKPTERTEKTSRRVLSISPSPEDHDFLRTVLETSAWELCSVDNCRDAIARLRSHAVSVIFCEGVLEDGTWKDILTTIQGPADAPALIVTSRLADAFLWSEVLNLGGYDVLAKPFSQREVRHVIDNVVLLAERRAGTVVVAGAA